MSGAAAAGCVTALLYVFVQFPLWCFILYSVLAAANVDRLVWVAFFIYAPVGLFCGVSGIIKALLLEDQ